VKITGLRTFVVEAAPGGGNWVFVKLDTEKRQRRTLLVDAR